MTPGAEHGKIRTCRTGSFSVITVEDDGTGFDTAKIDESHTTLANLRQRLEWMCEGKMEIISRDGDGTIVTVTIPDGATGQARPGSDG